MKIKTENVRQSIIKLNILLKNGYLFVYMSVVVHI